MQVVVNDETHGHDRLIIDLCDHIDQFWLQLGQSPEQVLQCLTDLTRCSPINDLVGEVDVALDDVHVSYKLLELGGDLLGGSCLATLRIRVTVVGLCRWILSLRWTSLVALRVLWCSSNRHIWESHTTLEQGLVDLGEVRQDLLLVLELLSPLFDQVGNPVLNLKWDKVQSENFDSVRRIGSKKDPSKSYTHLLVHFWVVQHSYQLLEESLAGHLLVERSVAPIHQNVKKTKAEEDDSELGHLEAAQQLIGHYLGATKRKQVG